MQLDSWPGVAAGPQMRGESSCTTTWGLAVSSSARRRLERAPGPYSWCGYQFKWSRSLVKLVVRSVGKHRGKFQSVTSSWENYDFNPDCSNCP